MASFEGEHMNESAMWDILVAGLGLQRMLAITEEEENAIRAWLLLAPPQTPRLKA